MYLPYIVVWKYYLILDGSFLLYIEILNVFVLEYSLALRELLLEWR